MTLAYENGVPTLDRACGVSEPPAAVWIAPVSDRQVEGRGLVAGCAGRHAVFLPILLVDWAVGAALRIFRLSGVDLPGVL